jgi:hypothetical protein
VPAPAPAYNRERLKGLKSKELVELADSMGVKKGAKKAMIDGILAQEKSPVPSASTGAGSKGGLPSPGVSVARANESVAPAPAAVKRTGLDAEDAVRVYEGGTADEKKRIRQMVRDKITNSKSINQDRRRELMKKLAT